MSMEKIGRSVKYTDTPSDMNEAIEFDVPYGKDGYRIGLSHAEMDKLLDKTYAAEIIGRESIIGSGFVIELENPGQSLPDLPLLALPHSLHIDKEPHQSPAVSLGVAIVTISHVYEHRGVLLADRYDRYGDGVWEFKDYEIQPPLRDIEEVLAAKS